MTLKIRSDRKIFTKIVEVGKFEVDCFQMPHFCITLSAFDNM